MNEEPFEELQCNHDKPKKKVLAFGKIPHNLCDDCIVNYAALGIELRNE